MGKQGKKKRRPKKNGQIYEIPFHMITILTELFKKMKKVKGVMLIIDYTKKKIFGNTIKGVKNQKVINPLLNPGMVDLSAHVDFSIIRNISEKFCLKYYGPSIQRDFLIKLGIIERSIILKLNANNKQKNKIDNSLNFLINKKKMGEVFQVISMSSKNIKKIVGFL